MIMPSSESNPMRDLFISELKVFKERWRALGQNELDASAATQLVKELHERIKSLRAGAKLAQCTLPSNLFDRFNQALENFPHSDKESFQSRWKGLLKELEKEIESLTLTPVSTQKLAAPEPATAETVSSAAAPLQEDRTMVDFFLIELESRLEVLNRGLLQLEQKSLPSSQVEELMRAAHAIKGGARLVNLDLIVQLTHAMEDGFVAVEKGEIELQESQIEAYLHAIDLLSQMSTIPTPQLQEWVAGQESTIKRIVGEIKTPSTSPRISLAETANYNISPPNPMRKRDREGSDRFLRVTARSLNRLIGLAGESLIQSRWLPPFGEALMKIKRHQDLLQTSLESLADSLQQLSIGEKSQHYLHEVIRHANDLRGGLSDRLSEFETFNSRFSTLAQRLYQEVISSRMRPFADGVGAFPRFVRDMAKKLGKQARLILRGTETTVDREILEKLEAPLSHLLRNAVDHGIETPEARLARGKDPEGTIIMEAQHRAGALFITVTDDGNGCDLDALRAKIVKRGLINAEMASHLSDKELLEFLFLPGFSTAEKVTEISGRGVGLSVVQSMVQDVGGDVHVTSILNKGMTFSLQLPLTLSVVRAFLVEIAGEAYALPLSRVHQLLFLKRDQIGKIENKFYFNLEGENIGLVSSHQVLALKSPEVLPETLVVVILYDQSRRYGIIVDKVIGQQELVVHELDPILGKVANISSGAFMEDGSPLLILDVEDVMHSIEKLQQQGVPNAFEESFVESPVEYKASILIVDDSATVREVESNLLKKEGYRVETAVDGIDGWNALRTSDFDLVLTDLDMPRMNGLELVRKIKGDPRFHALPVMIVSYKESEAERRRGIEAGADAYMTKGNFKDETLLRMITELLQKTGSLKLSDASESQEMK